MKFLLKMIIPARFRQVLRNRYRQSKNLYFRLVLNDYSQSGETVKIRKLLHKRKGDKGFFVELGANDGVTVSSTLGLIKDGWTGLAVEANPTIFAQLQRNWQKFSAVKTVCMAVAPKSGPIKLYFGKDDPAGLLSTISTESSAWFEEHRSINFVEVPGIPLTDLLDEQQVPKSPDLLLVDTEGMDYEILLTLDFNKYRPKLIVTEDYHPKNAVKFQLLEHAGYTFTQQVGCNTFWLDTQPKLSHH